LWILDLPSPTDGALFDVRVGTSGIGTGALRKANAGWMISNIHLCYNRETETARGNMADGLNAGSFSEKKRMVLVK
jgi:hypothetical protein